MDALELTTQLVAYRSDSHLSNRDVSALVAERLEALGAEVECTSYQSADGTEKVNVVGRLGSADVSLPGLAYFGHSDVVPAPHWTGAGTAYEATVHQDRLYGRGSCDMKGSLACMLTALARVDRDALRQPVYFVCTADEELSYRGANHLVGHSALYREIVARQARCLIGEPTELAIVHAHKGICTLRAVSQGEAAHSATREGRNANLAMIPFLAEMKRIHDETEVDARWQNDEFDPPTLSWNIGINDHTEAVNVKPAESVCTVFYRPLPEVDDAELVARAKAAAKENGLAFSVTRCNAVYTDRESPLVREALELSGTQEARTVSYGTDGAEFTELRQRIVCGPGSIAQAHTSNEWIALEQLTQGTQLYERFVRHWCCEAGR